MSTARLRLKFTLPRFSTAKKNRALQNTKAVI
jgi:hypothetical protein